MISLDYAVGGFAESIPKGTAGILESANRRGFQRSIVLVQFPGNFPSIPKGAPDVCEGVRLKYVTSRATEYPFHLLRVSNQNPDFIWSKSQLCVGQSLTLDDIASFLCPSEPPTGFLWVHPYTPVEQRDYLRLLRCYGDRISANLRLLYGADFEYLPALSARL